MAMLLPPAYIAAIKSVGVGPVLAVTELPSFGWIIRAVPSVNIKAQTKSTRTRIIGPQNESINPRRRPKGLDNRRKTAQVTRAIRKLRIPELTRAYSTVEKTSRRTSPINAAPSVGSNQ